MVVVDQPAKRDLGGRGDMRGGDLAQRRVAPDLPARER